MLKTVGFYLACAFLIWVIIFPDKIIKPSAAEPQKKMKVYSIDGQETEIYLPVLRTCKKICSEDQKKRVQSVFHLCEKAGFNAYRGMCCNAYCTGKIEFKE